MWYTIYGLRAVDRKFIDKPINPFLWEEVYSMNKHLGIFVTAAVVVMLAWLPQAQAQKYQCTPVSLEGLWNTDGWYHDDQDDPIVGTNNKDFAGDIWSLDTGTQRIKITTLPPDVKPGQDNLTEDGQVLFRLPKMNIGDLDAYLPGGETIPVTKGNYQYVFFAVMSGNGNWPGSEADWAPIIDDKTKKVTNPEMNSFKPIYADGPGDWISIGTVNDWFWQVPEWVAPASSDSKEIVVDFMTYDQDANEPNFLYDPGNSQVHNYGQYRYANGPDSYFVYEIPIPTGLKKATMWTEFWGNAKVSLSTDGGKTFKELYNTVTAKKDANGMDGETYPGGGDGYMPNRELRSFDLASTLSSGSVKTLQIMFEDAAPDIAAPWGPRSHQLGIFTGDTVKSRLGARLWPNLVRTDNAKPDGGLILIRKQYRLDPKRTLVSLQMPNNIPRSDPVLNFFAITLASDLPSGAAASMSHFKPGPDWVTGDGTWVVVKESSGTNNVMVGAAINAVDPKHAWVNKDFGPDYTVKCDVRMDTWVDAQDLSRAGIAARIQPDGTGGGTKTEDRGICMLFHENLKTIEFLNDMAAWANKDDGKFTWTTGTWYTFEMTVKGMNVSGKITNKTKATDTFTMTPWDFTLRTTGFPGLTACTSAGLMASFDNFQVIVNGNVVFSDDFEKPGPAISQKVGVSDSWVAGEAGYYVVDGGVLYGIATNGVDPKHLWFKDALNGGGSITGDCKMVSWVDKQDLTRAGFALHIQPQGTGGGRAPSATTPGEDRGINMLFHENVSTIEYLNDMKAWANLDDNKFPWTVGTWYTFQFTSDGKTVNGTITNKAKATDTYTLKPWLFPTDPYSATDKNPNRTNGFAGLTASTNAGIINAWDNIVIKDASGKVVFSDNFEGTTGVMDWSLY